VGESRALHFAVLRGGEIPFSRLMSRHKLACMGTSVYLKLKDGSSFPIGADHEKDEAERVKAELEQWLTSGTTLTIANAKGQLEEVTPRRVLAIDLIESGADPRQVT
jgi:hypothetical protein